jgi:major vault protein
VEAIGKDTIVEMANAGPELQAKLLEGLGLQGYLMMDSNNPVNLFNAAEGFVRPGGF